MENEFFSKVVDESHCVSELNVNGVVMSLLKEQRLLSNLQSSGSTVFLKESAILLNASRSLPYQVTLGDEFECTFCTHVGKWENAIILIHWIMEHCGFLNTDFLTPLLITFIK